MAYNEIEQRGTADFPILFACLDSAHPRYNMSAHWHSEIELIRILEGEFPIPLNSNRYNLKKGDCVFINPQTVHQGIPQNCIYECIVFHIDFLYSIGLDNNSFIKCIIDGEHLIQEYFPYGDNKTTHALNNIFDSFTKNSSARKFRVISAFYNFFAVILEENLYIQNIGNNKIMNNKNIIKLKSILSFLRENYDKPLSLEMISNNAKMSPKYLGSFFKNMTGKTPIVYLNEYRIEKASHKLIYTDMQVTDIAYSCGFADLSYFIKTFKCIKGVSPGKFRNM